VGVLSRLLCSSAWVKDEAALEGGAGTAIVDILLRRSSVKDGARARWWHFREVETKSLQRQHFFSGVCEGIAPVGGHPWSSLSAFDANRAPSRVQDNKQRLKTGTSAASRKIDLCDCETTKATSHMTSVIPHIESAFHDQHVEA
jgi:hypothetical protein